MGNNFYHKLNRERTINGTCAFGFTLIAILLLGITSTFSEQQIHPLCIVTESGWTLGIWPNGSAILLRTGNPKINCTTPSNVFDYQELVNLAKSASRRQPRQDSRLQYFFGEFDKAEVHELPELPTFVTLLDRAHKVFDLKNKHIQLLLKKYPLALTPVK